MRHMVHPAAAQALGKLGPAAAPAVPALIRMLRAGNPYEQALAGQSLGQIGTPALAPLVEVMVNEEGAPGRVAANALLRYYPWPQRGQPAVEHRTADQTATDRQRAIEALGTSSRVDDTVIRVLARAALDPAPDVRLAAVKALGRSNQNLTLALPQLVACSRDESPAIREWSARALGKVGPPGRLAVTALTRLARDDAESVRLAAQAALQALQVAGPTNSPALPR